MAKPKKKPKIGTAKKRAWDWFSKYIRLKYSDNGWCTCVTCGERKWWEGEGIQAGHGIAKGNGNGIYFLEEVIRPQCSYCNGPGGGRPDKFIPLLIELYGEDGVEEFVRMKMAPRPYKVQELQEMENHYKSEAKRMMEEL